MEPPVENEFTLAFTEIQEVFMMSHHTLHTGAARSP
jgi:hypothetical protein